MANARGFRCSGWGEGGANRVTLSVAGKETPGVAVRQAAIELSVAVGADQKAIYSYSLDGGRSFVRVGDAVPLSPFSWWKGSRPALFTYNVRETAGWIDVDWVHVVPERIN